MYLSCPVLFAAFKRWPQIRRSCLLIGLVVNTTAMIAASFATTVSHLILTQGILYACGGVLIYCPMIVFLDEWFIQRKGLAFGLMWAGTTILRTYAIAFIVLAPPFFLFVRPRLPLAQTSLQRRLDMSFLRSSTFWIPQT